MRYLKIEPKPLESDGEAGPLESILLGMLGRVFPAASEDLSHLWGEVAYWWLEVDDSGLPQREIGFDAAGSPIVLAPVGDKVGFLIDASDDWSDWEEESQEDGSSFEAVWLELWPRFEELEQ